MAIPKQTLTVRDPGLGIVESSDNAVVIFGCSSSGTVNTIVPIGSPSAAVDGFGYGPLPQAGANILGVAGGPVYMCRLTGTTAGAAGAVTKTAIGTSTGTITVAGAAYDTLSVRVDIVGSGTVAVGTFKYTLDYDRGTSSCTYSEVLTIPSGGTYAIPNTNLTLTFVPGAGAVFFQAGDYHTFATTAPAFSTTDLAAGFTALNSFLSTTPGIDVKIVVLAQRFATGSAAATMFGTLSTQLTSQESYYRYMRGLMDCGSGDTTANVKTALAAVADDRICPVYGDCDLSSNAPFAGFGAPRVSGLIPFAARVASDLISTDPARFASGALTGVLKIYHDEFTTEEMDAAKISTLRSWPAVPGYYITNGRLKSSAGSDFIYLQHGRVMDVACSTVAKAQLPFISRGVLTNDNGTIDKTEAALMEAPVTGALSDALSTPKNVEGRAGHVSEFAYAIDLTNNVLTSFNINSTVAIRPLGYAKSLTTELGFAANVGG
jgi:hypothetical protein